MLRVWIPPCLCILDWFAFGSFVLIYHVVRHLRVLVCFGVYLMGKERIGHDWIWLAMYLPTCFGLMLETAQKGVGNGLLDDCLEVFSLHMSTHTFARALELELDMELYRRAGTHGSRQRIPTHVWSWINAVMCGRKSLGDVSEQVWLPFRLSVLQSVMGWMPH